ncbi:hypothetical protein C5167_015843 [Papaver somniferum]|uniref:Oxidoreductase FAD/NAD(P)-binding domain-containing protein n=1 Tax=Papaver somniferum TaxID=3469 RepID=A0A4Y7JBH9_PAPSO|nr:hypothetical protein C5167_015843 [Papaver somniferum]
MQGNATQLHDGALAFPVRVVLAANAITTEDKVDLISITGSMLTSEIAGGLDIAPMFQVMEVILKNPDGKTQISVLYANISPYHILLKQTLHILLISHPNTCKDLNSFVNWLEEAGDGADHGGYY